MIPIRAACLLIVLLVGPGLGVASMAEEGSTPGRKVAVVAAENFWGSIAAQLGGDRVQVTSIIANPNADPHDYEPTAADARAFAGARLVIVNGIGYDPWAERLLAANPVRGRTVLDVGTVAGIPAGGNPHQWYSPPVVQRVIDAVTSAYKRLDPAGATDFDRQRSRFEREALARYHELILEIRARYAGTPVGASESLFVPMADALGLHVLTPASFLRAISQGIEPTVADRAVIDQQIRSHRIGVYVYNRQNATPDVQRQIDEATKAGIPITTITETLVPAGATFQAWQVQELEALARALARATRR